MNTDIKCDFSMDCCQQGQSLPLSKIIDSYIRTGVAPAPLPASQFEFNKDLNDTEMDTMDGHHLAHDYSEIDESKENLARANDRLAKVKALYEAEQHSSSSETKE